MMMTKSKSLSKINDLMMLMLNQKSSTDHRLSTDLEVIKGKVECENRFITSEEPYTYTCQGKAAPLQYRSIDLGFLGKIGMANAKIMIHNKLNRQI